MTVLKCVGSFHVIYTSEIGSLSRDLAVSIAEQKHDIYNILRFHKFSFFKRTVMPQERSMLPVKIRKEHFKEISRKLEDL